MAKSFRIGVAGLTHDHVWTNCLTWPRRRTASWWPSPIRINSLLDRVAQQYGCATYEDYREMVDRESLDALYVFCDNERKGWKSASGPPSTASMYLLKSRWPPRSRAPNN